METAQDVQIDILKAELDAERERTATLTQFIKRTANLHLGFDRSLNAPGYLTLQERELLRKKGLEALQEVWTKEIEDLATVRQAWHERPLPPE
jgi:hypothetical protein